MSSNLKEAFSNSSAVIPRLDGVLLNALVGGASRSPMFRAGLLFRLWGNLDPEEVLASLSPILKVILLSWVFSSSAPSPRSIVFPSLLALKGNAPDPSLLIWGRASSTLLLPRNES